MAKAKQLTVEVENRPGSIAQVAKTLADAKVNIVALLGQHGRGARLGAGGGGRPEQG
jgi:ACT domain-containing protein